MDTPEWVAEAARLRANGLTYKAIAEGLGVTENTVWHWLNRDLHREQTAAWKRRHGYRHPRKRRTTDGGKGSSSVRQRMPDMTTTKVSVRVPTSLAEAFRAVAERNDRKLSDELRALMKRHVAETFAQPKEPA